MYKKILVAMDTSAIGDRVFDTALQLAKISHSNLMLVHILSEEAQERIGPYNLLQANYKVFSAQT